MNKPTKLFLACLMSCAGALVSCQEDEVIPTATATLSDSTLTVSEAATSPLSITLNLSNAWATDLTFNLSTSGTAISGVDYEAISDELVIAQGETSATLTITPIDNYELETSERTLTIAVGLPDESGITLSLGEVTITFLDNETAGSVIAAFESTAFTTNEYLQDSIVVPVVLNTAFAEDIVLEYAYSGSAVDGTNFAAAGNTSVTIAAGSTSGEIVVPIYDTKSYGNTSELSLTLSTPENGAIALGNETIATITIINPVVDMSIWHLNEDYHRIYGYNTFADVAIPELGRSNSDSTAGTIFDEFFTFTYYGYDEDASADPNSLGFKNRALWSEEEYWKSTNVFNMQDFYAGKGPNTIDANVSSASAGLFIHDAIRLIPEAIDAKSGQAVVPTQKVKVYQRDETDDDIDNYPYFEVEISGKGTYSEETGKINLTITFDESEIGNGIHTRRFEIIPSADRRAR